MMRMPWGRMTFGLGLVGAAAVALGVRGLPAPAPTPAVEPALVALAPVGASSLPNIRRIEAVVRLEGPLAATRLMLELSTPGQTTWSGHLRLALPGGSSVTDFRAGQGQGLVRGTLRTGTDPAMDAEALNAPPPARAGIPVVTGPFVVAPGERPRVVITYEQTLAPEQPYRLPRLPPAPLHLEVLVPGQVPFVEERRAEGGDLLLPRSDAKGVRAGDLALVPLLPGETTEASALPELVVLVDTSASRRDHLKADLGKLRTLFDVLRRRHQLRRVTLVAFHQTTKTIWSGPTADVEAGLKALKKYGTGGGTNLNLALTALTSSGRAAGRDVVVVTDGQDTLPGPEVAREDLLEMGIRRLEVLTDLDVDPLVLAHDLAGGPGRAPTPAENVAEWWPVGTQQVLLRRQPEVTPAVAGQALDLARLLIVDRARLEREVGRAKLHTLSARAPKPFEAKRADAIVALGRRYGILTPGTRFAAGAVQLQLLAPTATAAPPSPEPPAPQRPAPSDEAPASNSPAPNDTAPSAPGSTAPPIQPLTATRNVSFGISTGGKGVPWRKVLKVAPIERCYDQTYGFGPGASGDLTVAFLVRGDGVVVGTGAKGPGSDALHQCVKDHIVGLRFENDAVTSVRVTLKLKLSYDGPSGDAVADHVLGEVLERLRGCPKEMAATGDGAQRAERNRGGVVQVTLRGLPRQGPSVVAGDRGLRSCVEERLRRALKPWRARLGASFKATRPLYLFGDTVSLKPLPRPRELHAALEGAAPALAACRADDPHADDLMVQLRVRLDGTMTAAVTEYPEATSAAPCLQRVLGALTVPGPARQTTRTHRLRIVAGAVTVGGSGQPMPPLADPAPATAALPDLRGGGPRAWGSLLDQAPGEPSVRSFVGGLLDGAETAAARGLARRLHDDGRASLPVLANRRLAYSRLRDGDLDGALEALRVPPTPLPLRRLLLGDLAIVAGATLTLHPDREDAIMPRLQDAGGDWTGQPSLRAVLVWDTPTDDAGLVVHDHRGGIADAAHPRLGPGRHAYHRLGERRVDWFVVEGRGGRAPAYTFSVEVHGGPLKAPAGRLGLLHVVESDGAGTIRQWRFPVASRDGGHLYLGEWVDGGSLEGEPAGRQATP